MAKAGEREGKDEKQYRKKPAKACVADGICCVFVSTQFAARCLSCNDQTIVKRTAMTDANREFGTSYGFIGEEDGADQCRVLGCQRGMPHRQGSEEGAVSGCNSVANTWNAMSFAMAGTGMKSLASSIESRCMVTKCHY
uniref:Uncharacterized protein n=1 Tax=Oryza punctata TaxID=4537 RepID=A0A0E0MN56_ORYPU